MVSWLDEAQKIIAKRPQRQDAGADIAAIVDLDAPEQEEALIKELRSLYENATQREIERAVNAARDQLLPPCNRKELMNFLRSKLED